MERREQMSRKRNHFILALLVISQVNFASFWSSLKFWEPDQVDTLIITGNYLNSRALAELVQLETDNPIILVSKDAFPDKFYYLPLPNEKTTTVHKMSRLKDILSFIKPKSALVIGDEKYVDKSIIQILAQKEIATLHVKSDSWPANAKSVAKHFDDDELVEKYAKILDLAHGRTGNEFATESVEPVDEVETPAEDELTTDALSSEKEDVGIEEPEAEVIDLEKKEEAKPAVEKIEKEEEKVTEKKDEVVQLEPEVIAVEDDEEIKKEAIEKIK